MYLYILNISHKLNMPVLSTQFKKENVTNILMAASNSPCPFSPGPVGTKVRILFLAFKNNFFLLLKIILPGTYVSLNNTLLDFPHFQLSSTSNHTVCVLL